MLENIKPIIAIELWSNYQDKQENLSTLEIYRCILLACLTKHLETPQFWLGVDFPNFQ